MRKTNKILALALAFLLIFNTINIDYIFGEEPNDVKGDFIFDDTGKVIKEYKGVGGNVVIPDGVVEIGQQAFRGVGKITKLELPEGLEKISDAAFFQCDIACEVKLPSTLKTIGSHAFYGALNSKYNVVFNDGLESIGTMAFGMSNLVGEIKLPSTLKTIGEYAFYGSKISGELLIPDSVVTIGNNAFQDVSLDSIIVGKGLKDIGDAIFLNCLIENVEFLNPEIPDGIDRLCRSFDTFALKRVYVPEKSFDAYYAKIKDYIHLACITYQSDEEFKMEGNKLVSYHGRGGNIVVPNGVVEIGEEAFWGADKITKLELPEGLEKISFCAFMNADISCDLELPSTLKIIEDYAFYNTYNSEFRIKFNEGLESIGEMAFYESNFEYEFNLPSTLKLIGSGAFMNSKISGKLVIPDSVIEIGDLAFGNQLVSDTLNGNMNSIERVVVGKGLQKIDSSIFGECKDIKEVKFLGAYVPENISNIFSEMNSEVLEKVYVPQESFDDYYEAIEDENIRKKLAPYTKQVVSIEIKKIPTKLEYIFGEKLDLTGLELVAKYDNNDSKSIELDECKITPKQDSVLETAGEQEVTVDYQGKKDTFKVNVLFSVKFLDKDGKQIGESQTVKHQEGAIAPEAPKVAGYNFVKWDKEFNSITANTEVKAIYERIINEEKKSTSPRRNRRGGGLIDLTARDNNKKAEQSSDEVKTGKEEQTKQPSKKKEAVKTKDNTIIKNDETPKASLNAKTTFKDVNEKAWYHDYIKEAVASNIIKGTSEDTFSPNTKATRAMVFTMIHRLSGDEVKNLGNKWYEPSMNWAKQKGISDGTRPEKTITREEIITMLYRYAGKPNAEKSLEKFVDSDKISSWAKNAIKWAVAEGIVQGNTEACLNPKFESTRAELVTIFVRFMKK